MIFSRFGTILSCEVIRDKRTGDSLQYAFIEFENQKDCEQAYFKMQGVLIDDHRIHVDFSQSVGCLIWLFDFTDKRRSRNFPRAGGMPRFPGGPSAEGSVELPTSRGNGSIGRPTTRARARTTTAWCSTAKTADDGRGSDHTAAARGGETRVDGGIESGRTAEVRIEADTTRNEGPTEDETSGSGKGVSQDRGCKTCCLLRSGFKSRTIN